MRLWIAALLLLMAGCATRVETDVTTFHSLTAIPRGKSFIMETTPAQEGSLQWRSYSQMVARQLTKYGLIQTTDLGRADLAVFMLYAIDDGRTTTSSVPIYGQTSSGGASTTTGSVGSVPIYGSTYTAPTYGITGYGTVEDTAYSRVVKLFIFDAQSARGGQKPILVYEATAKSTGSIGHLNVVMPYIVEAMFVDWPGPSGATQRRTLAMRE